MTKEHHPDSNDIMCPCSGTRRNQIRDLFRQGNDMDAISRRTGAISGCGGCEWEIEVFLETLATTADPGEK